MQDLLVKKVLHKGLDGYREKVASMTDEEWEDLNSIHLAHFGDVLLMLSYVKLLEKK